MVEHLSSMPKTLDSIPTTTKEINKVIERKFYKIFSNAKMFTKNITESLPQPWYQFREPTWFPAPTVKEKDS